MFLDHQLLHTINVIQDLMNHPTVTNVNDHFFWKCDDRCETCSGPGICDTCYEGYSNCWKSEDGYLYDQTNDACAKCPDHCSTCSIALNNVIHVI